jgi:HAD superfamily hydrolase (TIGR01490 family)
VGVETPDSLPQFLFPLKGTPEVSKSVVTRRCVAIVQTKGTFDASATGYWHGRARGIVFMMTAARMTDAETAPERIALFDLDGTLLAWDCQLLFRHFVLRREPWRGIFLPVFLAFLPFAGLIGSGRMKRVFLGFLWRMSPEQLAAHSRDFAKHVMPAIYPLVRAEVERHRANGDFLILASASPEFYVLEIGRRLGFDLTFGTVVETGSLFPRLVNHKGAAKVERLKKELPASYFENGKLRHCHGYTDSCADLPMLGLCDSATVVNPSPLLAALAEQSGWRVLRPWRPWRGRLGFAVRVLALLTGLGRDPAGIGVAGELFEERSR